MPRRRFVFIASGLLLVILVTGGAVIWALVQEPDFYQQALQDDPPPAVRKQAAKEFVQQTLQLVEQIQHSNEWSEEFTQQQINSWIAEELLNDYPELLPKGVADPRIRIVEGAVQVGFRFERDQWNGIVSLELRPWISSPNELAIEIDSARAGLVPIPLDQVLDKISSRFDIEGWHVEWKQTNGNDVLVVNLSRNEPDQPVLEAVNLSDGVIQIAGTRRSEADASPPVSTPQASRVAADTAPTHHASGPVRVADQSATK